MISILSKKIIIGTISAVLVFNPFIAIAVEPGVSVGPNAAANWNAANNTQSPTIYVDKPVTVDDINSVSRREWSPKQEGKPPREKSVEATIAEETAKCTLANWATNIATNLFSDLIEVVANPTVKLFVPVYDVLYARKEMGAANGATPSLDGFMYCLANSTIIAISESTIDWIRGGFNGNPTFIDDPKGLIYKIGTDTVEDFLTAFGSGLLCERFKLNLTLALQRKERPTIDKCTIDDLKKNVDQLMSGEDFSFKVWDEVVQKPQNNIFGAYLTADSALGQGIADETNSMFKQLEWGKGWLSWTDSENKIITPGSFVADKMLSWTGIQTDRLVLADEFNEVLSALFQELLKQGINEFLGT